jgi:hypothetical protein
MIVFSPCITFVLRGEMQNALLFEICKKKAFKIQLFPHSVINLLKMWHTQCLQ